MIDPLTALAAASAAVSQFKNLVNAGRDGTQALSKFGAAWADINEAERRAKNPNFIEKFSGSLEERAATAFSAKKRAMAIKKELETTIQFIYGPSGLREYKDTLRQMRDQKKKNEYAKAEMQRKIIEWVLGGICVAVALTIFGGVIWLIGIQQGKW